MSNFFIIAQAILAISLVTLILLQASSGDGLNVFGGGGGESYHTRKGIEKLFFYATIVLAVLFAINSLVLLLA